MQILIGCEESQMICKAPRDAGREAYSCDAAGGLSGLTAVLAADGVFKGHHGLVGLLNAGEFWGQQPYGTRLYYGDGIADYLHRDVLRAAVKHLADNP